MPTSAPVASKISVFRPPVLVQVRTRSPQADAQVRRGPQVVVLVAGEQPYASQKHGQVMCSVVPSIVQAQAAPLSGTDASGAAASVATWMGMVVSREASASGWPPSDFAACDPQPASPLTRSRTP